MEDFAYERPLGDSAACVDGAAQAAPCCHVCGHLFDFGDFGVPLITHQPGCGHSDAEALVCLLNAVLYDALERYVVELARLDPLVEESDGQLLNGYQLTRRPFHRFHGALVIK